MTKSTIKKPDHRAAVVEYLDNKRQMLGKTWEGISEELGFSYQYFVQVKNGSNNRPLPRKFITTIERVYGDKFSHELGRFVMTDAEEPATQVYVIRVTVPKGCDVDVQVTKEIPQNAT